MPNREAQLLVLGPFKGIDQTTDPRKLDPTVGTNCSNLAWNRVYQAYATARGRTVPFASNLTDSATNLYMGSTGNSPTMLYYGAINHGGTRQLWQSVGGAAWAQMTGIAFTADPAPGPAVTYNGHTFFNTIPPTQCADGTTTLFNWQLAAPNSAPTTAAGAAGSLNGTYQWVVTFFSINGESSPSPVSSPALVLTNQKGSLTNIPTSSDTSVLGRNIYRTGGTLGAAFFFVGGINDNVTTVFTDNTPETSVTGTQLILHRDTPPATGFGYVALHKERVWGFNSFNTGQGATQPSSDLWYSNFQAPNEFDTVNSVIQVENEAFKAPGDTGVGLASIGSELCALKKKTFWIVTGNSPDDPFVPNKIANVGCVSAQSIAVGDGTAFWISNDGAYQYDGQIQYIADAIRGFLRARTLADLQATVGWFQDHQYFVSFPNQALTYVYDLVTKLWSIRPWFTTAATYDPSPSAPGLTGAPVLGVAVVQSSSVTGQANLIDAAETDFGNPIAASFVSKIENNGSPWVTKRYRSVSVTALPQVTTATIIVTVNPTGVAQQQVTLSVDLSKGPTQKFSLPPKMVGQEVQVEIDTSTSALTTIDGVSVNGWEEREMISSG